MNRQWASTINATLFLLLIISVLVTDLSALIPMWYLLLSLLTFFIYGFDKASARKGQQRISENTLHWLAFAGGWPGALQGQQYFRHKNRKTSFMAVFTVTLILNCAALAWLHTPDGRFRLNMMNSAVNDMTQDYSLGFPEMSRDSH